MRRPNVVVVCLDSVRADCLGVAGHPVCLTPHLDRLAKDGAWFTSAYAEFPLTVPFRTAAVSGQYTFTHRPWTALRAYDLHLAELLRGAGYRTAAFSDTPFRSEVQMHRGFDEFREFPGKLHAPPDGDDGVPLVDWPETWFPPGNADDEARWDRCRAGWLSAFPRKYGRVGIELLVDEASAWIDEAAARPDPFLVWVDSFQAHEPWVPPKPYADMYQRGDYRGRYLPLPSGPDMSWLADGELDHIKALYWGEITHADAHVGRLVDHLDALGLADNTLIMVVSDHGVPLGEHGTIRKIGIPLYDEMARIVWLMRWPGRIEPQRVDAIVETPDLLPTVLDACGVEIDAAPVWAAGTDSPRAIDGESVWPLLDREAEAVHGAGFFGAWGLHSAVLADGWKLIDNRSEKPNELYHLPTDAGEHVNLAAEEAERAMKMHRRLWHFQRRWARALRA